MFSRKALKARAESRRNSSSKCGYSLVLKQGEAAARDNVSLQANPYQAGTEDCDVWAEGWLDWTSTYRTEAA